MFSYKKIFIGFISIIIFSIGVANATLCLFESHFIFKPCKYSKNYSINGLKPKDVWLTSADGTRIHAWYFPQSKPKNIILYLHGNKGNVTDRYDEYVQLHQQLSASIMIVDYHGFGKSEGVPNEKGMIQDAEVARAWLANAEHVEANEIILFGRSMGGGVAVDLAARLQPKALVLIGTFTSLPDVLEYHYPFLAAHLLMHNQFDSIHKLPFYSGPLLIIHGDADTLIPIKQGMELFLLARGKKMLIPIHGGQHFDAIFTSVYPKIGQFLATC